MKPLSIECPNLTCIINQSWPGWPNVVIFQQTCCFNQPCKFSFCLNFLPSSCGLLNVAAAQLADDPVSPKRYCAYFCERFLSTTAAKQGRRNRKGDNRQSPPDFGRKGSFFLSESTDTFVISSNIWTFYFTELENLSNFNTLTTGEILSGKNARAWVSMVLYLKKEQDRRYSDPKARNG